MITDDAINRGATIYQYHGKWPFWRWMGMQEPASVAFSLLNLLFHARGYSLVRKRVPDDHPMKSYYLGFAVVSINAWVWSSVFHTRDLPITEKLDYFSAAAAILFAFYYTTIRMFHYYTTNKTPKPIHRTWTLLCGILYLTHISYLSLLPRFDYTYNMTFNLIIGMSHNLLWLVYSLPIGAIHRLPGRPVNYYPPYAWKAGLFVLLTTMATSLELLDFPPWERVVDAHALWHLSTVPLAALWYDFLIQDATDEGWRGFRS